MTSLNPAIRDRMIEAIGHRGPDAHNVWQEDSVALLHCRLSIIDLSPTGAQPMISRDGRYVLVYNGEIYNYRALRAELEQGWEFRGSSDTEVLLAAITRWKQDALRRLNGIYAFALWDRVSKELWLVRDPLGVKPLYYTDASGFAFSSEIKGLRPLLPKVRVDHRSLHEFMFYGAPLGRNTLYSGIWQVLPGESVRFHTATGKIERLMESFVTPETATSELSISALRAQLRASVTSQMVADVPVGVLLSGGLDSSTITAFASDLGRREVHTFSVGFDDNPLGSELAKARLVAKHFNTNHHEIEISARDVIPILERMVEVYDGPFSDAANLPLYLLYGKLRGSWKVMLQGDGGDEIFAGYRRYQALRSLQWWVGIDPAVQLLCRTLKHAAPSILTRAARFTSALSQNEPALRMAYLLTVETNSPSPLRLLAPGLRNTLRAYDPFERYREVDASLGDLDPVQRMLWTDCRILLPDIFLTKVDRASMAHGIEVRVPLLDLDLVRAVLPLPAARKLRRGSGKALLRDAMAGILPPSILHQPKTGFSVPYGHWLRTGLRQTMTSALLDNDARWADIFDRPALELCVRQHIAGERDYGFLLWKMMNFAFWIRRSQVELA